MEILRQKYHHPRNDDLGDEHDNDGDDNKSLENEAEYVKVAVNLKQLAILDEICQ